MYRRGGEVEGKDLGFLICVDSGRHDQWTDMRLRKVGVGVGCRWWGAHRFWIVDRIREVERGSSGMPAPVDLKTQAALMNFRKLAGRWKRGGVCVGGGCSLIWAVTVTMINGWWKSLVEIRKNTCLAVPERRSTQTRCGSRKCSVPAHGGEREEGRGGPLSATASSAVEAAKPQIRGVV